MEITVGKDKWFSLLALLSFALGLALFTISLFPLDSIVVNKRQNQKSNLSQFSRIESSPAYDKLVFFVIDGLRYDFVYQMPKTQQDVDEGLAFLLKAQAHAPTVTLPRIKAMMTGTVPGFLDIVGNLGAGALSNDYSLIHQLKEEDKKIVFFGDDTWLKIFPNSFHRFEGVSSFFVTDYTEVDDNVTRNVDIELRPDRIASWDVLILHYLGLDHIGHIAGPNSPLIPIKLKEMDDVIHRILSDLATEASNSNTLVVVCGDHGMHAQGGHGGATEGEVMVPFLFWKTPQTQKHHFKRDSNQPAIWQIDIATTLGLAMGVGIPVRSMGRLIDDVLRFDFEKLIAHQKTAWHLLDIAQSKITRSFKMPDFDWEMARNDETMIRKSIGEFDGFSKAIQTELLEHRSSGFGVTSLIVIGSLLTGGLWISLCCFARVLKATTNSHSLTLIFREVVVGRVFKRHPLILCSGFAASHALSYFGGSYIEEEHQTWIYFSALLHFFFVYRGLVYFAERSQLGEPVLRRMLSSLGALFLSALLIRVARTWNAMGDKWRHLGGVSDWLTLDDNYVWLLVSAVAGLELVSYSCRAHTSTQLERWAIRLVAVSIYLFKFCTGRYLFLNQIYLAWFVYVLLAFLVMSQLRHLQPRIKSSSAAIFLLPRVFLLFCALIVRTPNIWLLGMMSLNETLLRRAATLIPDLREPIPMGFLYHCMANGYFFMMGNSNSIATVDLTPGYVGLTGYSPVLVGLLSIAHTFCAQIFWYASYAAILAEFKRTNIDESYRSMSTAFTWSSVLILLRGLLAASTCVAVYVHREHLFILSVFAPKLLYEFAHALLLLIMVLIGYSFDYVATAAAPDEGGGKRIN